MNRIRSSFLGLITSFLILSSASLAYAGGGPVEFTVEPNSSLNPSEQYVVHARVYTNGPYPTYCKNCLINLAFENPQGSDYIAQNSDRTDNDGRIYAKVISKIPGKRILIVKDRTIIDPDGLATTANSSVVLNYLGDTPTPTPQPTPEGNIYVKVGTQKYIDGPKRAVILSWSQVQNAVKYYNVYARLADSNEYGAAVLSTGSLSGEININAFLDYYVRVDACSNPGICMSSQEVFVKAMSQGNEVKPTSKPSVPTLNSSKTVVSPNPNVDNKVEELNKKVENLQTQLEASKQKQNTLEQRLSDLVNFIKRFFPFFN